ncbi:unnamed protein product [Tetraodon nigroviridis]|uniref:(spotted green pufferfish) hypothetical protein n=1 Tax=Tetraodon nigroviridis TaxID=99883 RepID=Q4TAW4_TETNG|nr:unnamed protein product [Tetraodon nigroviridis]
MQKVSEICVLLFQWLARRVNEISE